MPVAPRNPYGVCAGDHTPEFENGRCRLISGSNWAKPRTPMVHTSINVGLVGLVWSQTRTCGPLDTEVLLGLVHTPESKNGHPGPSFSPKQTKPSTPMGHKPTLVGLVDLVWTKTTACSTLCHIHDLPRKPPKTRRLCSRSVRVPSVEKKLPGGRTMVHILRIHPHTGANTRV